MSEDDESRDGGDRPEVPQQGSPVRQDTAPPDTAKPAYQPLPLDEELAIKFRKEWT